MICILYLLLICLNLCLTNILNVPCMWCVILVVYWTLDILRNLEILVIFCVLLIVCCILTNYE